MRFLIIIFVLSACCSASAGELADLYYKKVRANPANLEQWMKQRNQPPQGSIVATNFGISEIGIERTGCFGTCPAYTFIVKSDGSFRYLGGEYAERQGEFSGSIPAVEFDRLARFIKDSGYMKLSDTYYRPITDHSTTFTMVVMGGKQKVISDYAGGGPSTLWAIEELIDSLLHKARWNEGPKSEDTKK